MNTPSAYSPSNNAVIFPAQLVYLENQKHHQVTQMGEKLIYGHMKQKITHIKA